MYDVFHDDFPNSEMLPEVRISRQKLGLREKVCSSIWLFCVITPTFKISLGVSSIVTSIVIGSRSVVPAAGTKKLSCSTLGACQMH